MQAYIITRGDARRFRVLKVIERYGWDPVFVCHSMEQRASLISLGVCRSAIRLSRVPAGVGIREVALARDEVCKRLMPRGEWCLWLDDNVGQVTGIPYALSADKLDFDIAPVIAPVNDGATWRALFARDLTPSDLDQYIGETLARAEARGTILCGFANERNYYFRARKWQDYGYCRTRFALYKNDGSTWVPFEGMMLEDLYKSIDVVARYGRVVINRHLSSVKPMFEVGGLGSFGERLPHLQSNCKKMMEMYPGLLKYDGDGKQYGLEAGEYHLTFAKRSQATVDAWRRAHGYL